MGALLPNSPSGELISVTVIASVEDELQSRPLFERMFDEPAQEIAASRTFVADFADLKRRHIASQRTLLSFVAENRDATALETNLATFAQDVAKQWSGI